MKLDNEIEVYCAVCTNKTLCFWIETCQKCYGKIWIPKDNKRCCLNCRHGNKIAGKYSYCVDCEFKKLCW